MSPEVRKLTEKLGVEETLNRLLGFARTAHAWKQATGEKLNTQHYVAVVSALSKEQGNG
jgi:hypothetical protein